MINLDTHILVFALSGGIRTSEELCWQDARRFDRYSQSVPLRLSNSFRSQSLAEGYAKYRANSSRSKVGNGAVAPVDEAEIVT